MSDQLPRRPSPWDGGWMWPPQERRTPARAVRLGDVERDEAVNRLSDHYAAGRLTREEFDERSDAALHARFARDLEPLFADLPETPVSSSGNPRRPTRRAGMPSVLMLLIPLLLVLIVVAGATGHPPLLFGPLIWLFVFARFGSWGRRR